MKQPYLTQKRLQNQPYNDQLFVPYDIKERETVMRFFDFHFRIYPITPQKNLISYLTFITFFNQAIEGEIKCLTKKDIKLLKALYEASKK